ncbi:MAG: hypothetical protein VXY07_03380 [Planctomycetota bacterium]|nr:hypothetical protein [Planctomycetota bacterium]MEC7446743.1 hypothetical protein [Planctomycetota bacterium]MEC7498363.1 hypothetical protein [Planctomycetota bacterium]MEC7718790.1 hypothetical protein [Planctomycetota bacterium]MEC8300734.1 hypothetical protein [Planctomycetota bacterium]
MPTKIQSLILLLGSTLGAIGCQNVATWQPPGTIQQQRNRASMYDPFPDNQMGPPLQELRPREFSSPLAEPARAQLYSEIRNGYR